MYYQKEVNLVLKELNSSKEGLTKKEMKEAKSEGLKKMLDAKQHALKIVLNSFFSNVMWKEPISIRLEI